VLWPIGEINRSRQLADEAVSGLEIKRPLVQANELVHKTIFDALVRQHSQMMRQAEMILIVAKEHKLPLYVAAGTYLNGLARWRTSDRSRGLDEMHQGWALLHENDCYLYEPFWGIQVVEAEAKVGQVETGLAKLSELIGSVEKTGQRWLDAELYRVRGELLQVCDPPDVAASEDALQRAIDIAKSQQTKIFELRAAMSMARLWRDQGKRQQAHDLLAPVYGWFTEGFDTLDLKEAKTLLSELSS
jgi:predicted ATPase